MLLGLYQTQFRGSERYAVFFPPAPEIQDFCTRNNLEGIICTCFRTGLAWNHFPACSSCSLLRARHRLAAQLDKAPCCCLNMERWKTSHYRHKVTSPSSQVSQLHFTWPWITPAKLSSDKHGRPRAALQEARLHGINH